jgi:hypothetical protein
MRPYEAVVAVRMELSRLQCSVSCSRYDVRALQSVISLQQLNLRVVQLVVVGSALTLTGSEAR